jgi:hypothetical protein
LWMIEIVFNEVCGEAGDVLEENVADWFAKY